MRYNQCKFNNKVRITLILFLISMIPMHAQTQKPWQWVKQLGGEGLDIVNGITKDTKNNLYVAGSFFSTIKGPGGKAKSLGNQDFFIASFDESGGIKDLWSGGGRGADEATCITISSKDLIIVGGTISDTVSFGRLKDAGQGRRLFVTSMTNKGKFSWISTLINQGTATLTNISTDKAGNIYALGVYTGELTSGSVTIRSAGRNDLFLAKYNLIGTLEKLITIGGEEDDYSGALAVTDSGDVICSGQSGKEFMLGSLKVKGNSSKPRANAFLVSFNTSLEPVWVQNYTGEEYCTIKSLAFDENKNLYVGGSFNFTVNTGDTIFSSRGYSDMLLITYSPERKRLWGRNVGSNSYDYAYQVIPDKINGAMVIGSLGDTLQVDSLSIYPLISGNSAMILQFDSTGRATWGDCITGKGRNFGSGALLDNKGNLFITGSFRETFEKEEEELTSFGDQDVFVAKYFNCITNEADINASPWLCPGRYTTLSVKGGYKKIVWNDSIHNTSYLDVDRAGIYRVKMYDKRGCELNGSITVSQIPNPGLELGNDTSLWMGDSLLLSVKPGFVNYAWNDAVGGENYLAMAQDERAGTYLFWISATDTLACTWSDTIRITFTPIPERIDLEKAELVSYPNPAVDEVYWYLKTEAPCKLFVELTDEHGRAFYQESVVNYMPGELRSVDLSNIPMGPYYIRIKSPGAVGQVKTLRIIKR